MADEIFQSLLKQNTILEEQNELLKEQNGILREQNNILVKNTFFTGAGAIFGLAAIAIALVALIK